MSKKHLPVQRPNNNPSSKVSGRLEVHQESYQGPLPHPKILHEYDQIVPGAAERIICMAEDQAKHRQSLEKDAIGSDIRDGKRGLLFGFIIGIVAILSGTACIIWGHDGAGGTIGGSAIPALAGVFVYGSRQRRKEREAKNQQIAKNK